MCKTTRRSSKNYQNVIKKFTACLPFSGSKIVNIKIFDHKTLLSSTVNSTDEMKAEMIRFFNLMISNPGLKSAVAQNLQTFSFNIDYKAGKPTASERDGFSALDFPVYLESLEGSTSLTAGSAKDLLTEHKIPETSTVKEIEPGNSTATRPIAPYKAVEDFIDTDITALGLGIGGPYFVLNSQNKCRKIGIILVDRLTKNITFANRQNRFLHVLKHELGHMFGIAHHKDTIMDEKYSVIQNHPMYLNAQIEIINGAFTELTRN